MGDNIYLGDRDGVRTPMQWSPDRNGGFSRADPAALVLPPIMDPLYGYEAVNVEAQARDPHSLLQLDAAHAGGARASTSAFGRGTLRFLYPKNRKVLAYLREYEGETDPVRRQSRRARAQAVELDLSRIRRARAGRADRRLAVPADRPADLSADAAALRLLLVHAGQRERCAGLAHAGAGADARISAPSCCATASPTAARAGSARRPRARDAAGLSAKRRWFAAKDETLQSARIAYVAPLPGGERDDAAGRGRSDSRRRHRALAAAAGDRLGGRAAGAAAAASSRWPVCAAAGASAC